jgi:hypothetical protein
MQDKPRKNPWPRVFPRANGAMLAGWRFINPAPLATAVPGGGYENKKAELLFSQELFAE